MLSHVFEALTPVTSIAEMNQTGNTILMFLEFEKCLSCLACHCHFVILHNFSMKCKQYTEANIYIFAWGKNARIQDSDAEDEPLRSLRVQAISRELDERLQIALALEDILVMLIILRVPNFIFQPTFCPQAKPWVKDVKFCCKHCDFLEIEKVAMIKQKKAVTLLM